MAPLILNFGFTPRPLCRPAKRAPLYSLNRGLGGPQSRSGYFEEDINCLIVPFFEPRYFRGTFRRLRHCSDRDTPAFFLERMSCDLDAYTEGQTGMPKEVGAVLHALNALQISSGSWWPCNVRVPYLCHSSTKLEHKLHFHKAPPLRFYFRRWLGWTGTFHIPEEWLALTK
jgi:hypothetical protein